MPKISVIVPMYNVRSCVPLTLESIKRQSFADFEAIVVDDGSTDGSLEVAKETIGKDLRFSFVRKQNGGLTSARLAGFERTHGEYILFVDSDDVLEDDMLFELISEAERSNADVTMCSYNIVRGDSVTPVRLPVESDFIPCERLIDDYILPTVSAVYKSNNFGAFMWIRLFKRSVIGSDCFMSEREYFNEDLLFNMQSVKNILNGVAVINKPLYNYIQNNGSLTLKYREGLIEKLAAKYRFCEKYFDDIGALHKAEERLIYQRINSVCACVRNAARLGRKSDFKAEMKSLYKNPFFIEALKIPQNVKLDLKTWTIMRLASKNQLSLLWKLLKK